MRTLAAWLSAAGHQVQVLCGGTFPDHPAPHLEDELRRMDVAGAGRYQKGSRALVHFQDSGAKIQLVCTGWEDTPSQTDERALSAHAQRLMRDFRPEVTLISGGNRALKDGARLARQAGSKVLYALWDAENLSRPDLEHANAVLAGGPELAEFYRATLGIQASGYPPPLFQDSVIPDSAGDGLGLLGYENETLMDLAVEAHAKGARVLVPNHASVEGVPFEFPGLIRTPKDLWGQCKTVLIGKLQSRYRAEAIVAGVACLDSETGIEPHFDSALLQPILDRQTAIKNTFFDPEKQRDAYVRFVVTLGHR
jgi:hypothetical protein